MYQRLRISAINDLKRLTPSAHYVGREYDLRADLELTESLLARPASLGLTPLELVAAHALDALTRYQLMQRAAWAAVDTPGPIDDHTPPTQITHDQKRHIDARCELFRVAALIYARTLGDAQLIEAYQPDAPAIEAAPMAGASGDLEWVEKAQIRAREIIKRQRDKDYYPNQVDIADEIAKEFRAAGIVGADDKPLSGGTIKRHALKGISSAQGKQQSTTISRGK